MNGEQNTKIDLNKQKHSSLNIYQTPFQIPINHFMLCATQQILASAHLYYNHRVEQIKRILFQQIQDDLHKLNLDSLHF